MPTIYFVEDDQKFGDSLKLSLELAGYTVHLKRDVKTALKDLETIPADLFLFDVQLPDGTGLDVAKKMSDKKIDKPILFLTARDDEETAEKHSILAQKII